MNSFFVGADQGSSAFALLTVVVMGNVFETPFSSRFHLLRLDLTKLSSDQAAALAEAGISRYYQTGLWNYCTSSDASSDLLRPPISCGKHLAPFRGLPGMIETIGSGILDSWKSTFNTMAYTTFFLLMAATANALLCLPLAILSSHSRAMAISSLVISIFTALSVVVAAILVTLTYTTLANKINSSPFLISAKKGSNGMVLFSLLLPSCSHESLDVAILWFASVLCILGAMASSFHFFTLDFEQEVE